MLVRQGLVNPDTQEKTKVETKQIVQEGAQQRAKGGTGVATQEQTRRLAGQEVFREEVANEGARQEVAPQEAPQEVNLVNQIWRPPGHPPVTVDECVENVSCEGNCEHVKCLTKTTWVENRKPVTCHDCKNKFKDKVAMMNHKRDSDHPSKKKCNKFPDCERAEECWYMHRTEMLPQISKRTSQEATHLACNVCEQIFNQRNELMFHRKRAHPSNIVCRNFLAGYCRRGASGENCWYRHDQLPTNVTNVARLPVSLPPPGSTSWESDFPLHPAMEQ